MKKFTLLYGLSFISYPLVLAALPYITAKSWANGAFYLFLAAVCYQLVYLLWLRKKEAVGFGKALAQLFLYAFFGLEAYILFDYADHFINGFTETDWLGNAISETVYGFSAIAADGWMNLIYVPALMICIIYQIVYFVIRKKNSPNAVQTGAAG